jgi:hypothetical protein
VPPLYRIAIASTTQFTEPKTAGYNLQQFGDLKIDMEDPGYALK